MKDFKTKAKIITFLLLISVIAFSAVAEEFYMGDLKSFLTKELHGDVLVMNMVASRGKLFLKNPMTLRQPYFEEIRGRYGQIECYKPIVKSANKEGRGAFELEVARMVFSRDGVVLFVPMENCMEWKNTRGYAAIMKQSDIVSWMEMELQRKSFERKLDKRGARVLNFPFMKGKYLKMNILWQSEETWHYVMSFFSETSPSSAKCDTWRLYSIFGECHGW